MTRYKDLNKKVVECLKHFAPSRYSFLVFIFFYMSGLVFAILKPQYAASTFYYGFFLGIMEVKIQLPNIISLNYLLNQFFYYLGRVSSTIFLNNITLTFLCVFTGVAIIPRQKCTCYWKESFQF